LAFFNTVKRGSGIWLERSCACGKTGAIIIVIDVVGTKGTLVVSRAGAGLAVGMTGRTRRTGPVITVIAREVG